MLSVGLQCRNNKLNYKVERDFCCNVFSVVNAEYSVVTINRPTFPLYVLDKNVIHKIFIRYFTQYLLSGLVRAEVTCCNFLVKSQRLQTHDLNTSLFYFFPFITPSALQFIFQFNIHSITDCYRLFSFSNVFVV